MAHCQTKQKVRYSDLKALFNRNGNFSERAHPLFYEPFFREMASIRFRLRPPRASEQMIRKLLFFL